MTALLAWFVFRENFDRRIALGMAAIVAGGVLLSWGGTPEIGVPWGALAIGGACLVWALDVFDTVYEMEDGLLRLATGAGIVAAVGSPMAHQAIGQTLAAAPSALARMVHPRQGTWTTHAVLVEIQVADSSEWDRFGLRLNTRATTKTR